MYVRAFSFKTKKNTEIPVLRPLSLTDEKASMLDDIYRVRFGKERRRSDPSYNCHGLTFIGKLGWISPDKVKEGILVLPGAQLVSPEDGDEIVKKILIDNGLRMAEFIPNIHQHKFKGNDDIALGDVAVYRLSLGEGRQIISHTGIVAEVIRENLQICDFRILSKMGFAGEFIHPYNIKDDGIGQILEIWTDREQA